MPTKEILQKSIPNFSTMSIKQSNRVTDAQYDFTMMQLRIFTWLMFYLQEYIKKVMSGHSVHQMPLFDGMESDHLLVEIPLNYLGRPDQYGDIREAAKKLTTQPFSMDDMYKKFTTYTSFVAAIKVPHEGTRSSMLGIEMRKDVIKSLMHVDRNGNTPIRYSSYMLYVAATCKNKYTGRIYMYLSAKKDLGGLILPLKKLRDMLQLKDNNYSNFSDFKRFILTPVQKELNDMGDFWFNFSEIKEKKKVTDLKIIIGDIKPAGISDAQREHIKRLTKIQLLFTEYHCDKMQAIYLYNPTFKEVLEKIQYIDQWCEDNPTKVKSKAAVGLSSLLKEFVK